MLVGQEVQGMRVAFAIMAFVLFSAPAFAAPGAKEVRAGNDLYRQGKFPQALEQYEKAAQKNPGEARIEYDLGAAAYKAQDYDAAADHFQKSLLTDDDKFRQSVHFNLGDAFYRAGVARENNDIEQGVKRLESSLESFEKARALDVKDKEAIENYEFVKKELERLKQKQQQQDQQQSQRTTRRRRIKRGLKERKARNKKIRRIRTSKKRISKIRKMKRVIKLTSRRKIRNSRTISPGTIKTTACLDKRPKGRYHHRKTLMIWWMILNATSFQKDF
jgi:Ca-activated chloride channel family protein